MKNTHITKRTTHIVFAVALLPLFASCSTFSTSERPIFAKTDGNAPYVAPAPITGKRKVGTPYTVLGQRYYPISSSEGYREEGIASWYGADFHGKKTANGEIYNMYDMTAAHTQLPIPTYVRVTNQKNGRSVIVRVNDRGPFVKNRLIDMSYRAAVELGMHKDGTAPVLVEALPTDGSPLRPYNSQPTTVMMAEAEPIKPVVQPAAYTPIQHKSSGFTHRIAQKRAQQSEQTNVVDNSVETKEPVDNSLYAQVNYYIQTGAFSSVENAQNHINSINSLFDTVSIHEHQIDGRMLYRVRIGPLATSESADVVTETLARNGYENSHIVIENR